MLAGSTGEYWRATPVRYWLDTWQDAPARDTQRDLASCSGGILGAIHWRATLGHSAGYSAGSTGELLWWDTRQDPLAGGILGGILGGIHWRAALAGYSDKFFAR